MTQLNGIVSPFSHALIGYIYENVLWRFRVFPQGKSHFNVEIIPLISQFIEATGFTNDNRSTVEL